jgi:hypothetical protein
MLARRPEKVLGSLDDDFGCGRGERRCHRLLDASRRNVVRPEAPGSNAGEVWVASTEFKFVPATVRVIAGRSVTLVLDNSQAETEHGIKLPAFGDG